MEWINNIEADPDHISREREKAKSLKKTNWWRQVKEDGICHYCKKKFPPEKLTMDHIVPLARGGKSRRGNIVPSCGECNKDKSILTPVDIILQELKDEGRL